jgi:outer membrane protein TolC
VHVAELRERAIAARGDALVAMAELNHLRGAPIASTFDVARPAPATPADALADQLPAWLADVDSTRASVRQAAAALRGAEARVRQAQRSIAPSVAAFAAWELDGITIGSREAAWTAGAELRWALGLGGGERARVRAARAAVDQMRADYDAARSRAQLGVVEAIRRLETAQARAAAVAEARTQAAESLRITRNRYDAGIASLTDVLRAVSAALDTQHRQTAAEVDLLVAEAELRRAIGRAPGTPLT